MYLKQDNLLDLISIQIWTCSGNEETIRAGLLQWAGVDWQCRAQTNQIYFLNFFYTITLWSELFRPGWGPRAILYIIMCWDVYLLGEERITWETAHWFAPQKYIIDPPSNPSTKVCCQFMLPLRWKIASVPSGEKFRPCFHASTSKAMLSSNQSYVTAAVWRWDCTSNAFTTVQTFVNRGRWDKNCHNMCVSSEYCIIGHDDMLPTILHSNHNMCVSHFGQYMI